MKKYLILFLSFAMLSFAYSNCMQAGFKSAATGINVTNPLGSGGALGGGGSGGGGGTGGGGSGQNPGYVDVSGPNVMSVSVGCGYPNEPCVSVTICVPGTSNCQTINNLLLDTGSTGLRVFSSAVSLSLPTVVNSSNLPYAACAVYGDSTVQWGPVKKADIKMGQNTASNVSIEVVDFSFGDTGSACLALAGAGGIKDQAAAGYNGILGLQGFAQDCGSYCQNTVANQIYYACNGSSCSSAAINAVNQLENPVAFLDQNNNGFVLRFPPVASTGGQNIVGTLALGVSTQSNNTVTGMSFMAADPNTTTIKGTYNSSSYNNMMDTGSEGLYFPDSSISVCTSASGWYCPSSTLNLSATLFDYNGANPRTMPFSVANADYLYVPNNSFNNLAGPMPSNIPVGSVGFLWGMPFFFGKTVIIGIEGRTSNLGSGPYYAF